MLAADLDAGAVRALARAAAGARGLRPIVAEARDLFRRPLRAGELAGFDGVLFDPPRAGAEAQAREIATSVAPLAVAVSCNAATFARDARILIDGGFRIGTVMAVDQFRFSPHVEVAAIFRRPPQRARARRLLG